MGQPAPLGAGSAPALLAGCTVILKNSPEASGEGYLIAEAAEAARLPAGVLNVLTADREVSELLVRDPRVDKITFTGSTAAGRRIASICGGRIARCTLELGGKSAAVILDDIDIETASRPRWARWPPCGSATGWKATSPRASPTARPWPPAAAAPRSWTAAGTSSRLWHPEGYEGTTLQAPARRRTEDRPRACREQARRGRSRPGSE